MKNFEKIAKEETNEFTALVLMLGVLGDKLTGIAGLISTSNTLSSEIIECLKKQSEKKEFKPMRLLSRDDYID